ncbi:MAG: glycosyltransferase family 39 protein, partial [Chloroflexota bacterium]
MTLPHRARVTLMLAVLIILSAGLRALTYDRYLPLLDYSDESNMFLLALDMRGTDEVPLADDYGAPLTGEWLAGYPPLFPWINVWGGRALEAATDDFLFPSAYIHLSRVLAVVASVLTVPVMFAFGATVARPLGSDGALVAGAFAALPSAINPLVVDVGTLAIPDSFIPLACAIALWGAARAITQDAPLWLVWSLLGAVAAIYLKYSVLVGLWAVFCGVVMMIKQRGWRASLPWIAVLAVISAVTAGYLVWGYGALGLENREANNFREVGLAN